MLIDNKYKIPYHGTYHKGINDCPHCGFHLLNDLKDDDVFSNYCCGFSNTEIGLLMVIECPKCFKKWSFHVDQNFYDYFLESVDGGSNVHFK